MHPRRRSIIARLVVTVATAFACSDQPTAPEPQLAAPALKVTPFTTELLSPQWQDRTRTLVGANSLNPFASARVFTAVSVAQYRAVVGLDAQLSASGNQGRGFGAGGRSLYEAQRGAIAGASVEVLSFLFPAAANALEDQVIADGNASAGAVHPDFARGLAVGRAVGEAMIVHLQNDGSTLPWTGSIPVGPGYWTSNGTPGGANLGGRTPYLVNSTSQFRSAPPPAWGSAEFQADLEEALTIAQSRTPQQTAIAQFWAAAGPGGPPGYWNSKAATYVDEGNLNEVEAARIFALMHAAQHDAMLTCFESKYFYFVLRPSQAEPLITPLLVFANPNYPAYPSGHACVSSSAAHVLKHIFADRTEELTNLVTEAGESRIYGGIHYRFDITASWVLGTAVAQWAIDHEDRLL